MVSMDYVEKILRNISLKQNDYVVVAVSGGPDSMALLNISISMSISISPSMCACES